MKHARLLDCTLRDGAYLVNKDFGEETIKGIINGLVEAKIDFVEIGFFQDEGFGIGKTVYKNSKDAMRYVPKEKNGVEFTVLADYSRFSIENLDEHSPYSVDVIRECFFKHERYKALDACKVIKDKGYKLFIQPVDILGYSDIELVEFIHLVNQVEPFCISIVDTFGSMYQEDLHRVFELLHHNLIPSCRIGFHSHNNMQLSNALSQEFIRMTCGKREVVVDGTISGMGRGAGNTPTELIAQYMVSKHGYPYNIDAILDLIDGYMDNIKSRCTWGYSTAYFVAGCYSAHVNNIAYLSEKNSIRAKDIRYIINSIDSTSRKRYDYELLEKTYIDYLKSDIDDSSSVLYLRKFIGEKTVLVISPGSSIINEESKIKSFIDSERPVIITVNFVHDTISSDFVYISNLKRYNYWNQSNLFLSNKKIVTSNIDTDLSDDSIVRVSFLKLVKCGWEHLDNSTVMLLRLLDRIGVNQVVIAGFDGYDFKNNNNSNYVSKYLELSSTKINSVELNKEINSMLEDFAITRVNQNTVYKFITRSKFEDCFNKI